MRAPAEFAQVAEDRPALPPGDCERVSGYGVMGLPFASGHVLGLRRWTASSVGEQFTSIWHRDAQGNWTFYESAPPSRGRSGPRGPVARQRRSSGNRQPRRAPTRLQVRTADGVVDWTVELEAKARTRMMSTMSSIVPMAAWRSERMLHAIGAMAGPFLGVGKVQLTGTTSNRQHFDANPLRIWYVTESSAVVDGEDLGPIGPLQEQAHMADFYFPQRGMFAVGRVFITPMKSSSLSGAEAATGTH